MKLIEDAERKVAIGLPDIITAEAWRKFYVEREKYALPGPIGASYVAAYMAALTLIDQGHYEDMAGKTITLKEAGMNVPAYVMIWVASRAQEAMNEALDVPKAS